MKILKGQRWYWNKLKPKGIVDLVEALEDSVEFDLTSLPVGVKCRFFNHSYQAVGDWYFGGEYHKYWEYLEGQDAPK